MSSGATVELFGDSTRDGEWAAVRLEVEGQTIIAADAPGVERDLTGLTLLEAAAVGGEMLAVDALANAIGPTVTALPDPGRTAVAMSGGVDSAVALLAAGDNAVGVTLRLWIDPSAPDTERACCSPASVIAARQSCHARGLAHVTLDLREQFRAIVVKPFTQGYARGETPNPCVRCNGSFRFDELMQFVDRIGAGRLSTGHYARIAERGGRLAVARAADEAKDQSYMLATLDPAHLDRIWFPLGGQTKQETRAQAAAAGLAAATKAESQEACFLGGDDYRAFLGRQGVSGTPGPLVDEEGNRVGTHEGFWRYTAGQRRGLGIAAAEPLYAVETVAATNTVVVGPRSALARTRVSVRGRLDGEVGRVEAKLRHRSPAMAATATRTADGFDLLLDEPAYGVAPGQTAVLYEHNAVVGAGVILGSAGQ
ncbi:MAG TPA: tRNA 2-thiouridine(34) synthase MnmA [Gaiellaceae bacterium]